MNVNAPQPVTASEINDRLNSVILQVRLANPNGNWNKAIGHELSTVKQMVAALEAYARSIRSELDKRT